MFIIIQGLYITDHQAGNTYLKSIRIVSKAIPNY